MLAHDDYYTYIAILSALVIAVVAIVMSKRSGKSTLPPGPSGLPIVGSLPYWKGPETNLEWTKQYGDIYSVKMGPQLTVYLNNIDLVKEYMIDKGDSYLDRPSGPAAIGQGILFGSGELWKVNRKLGGKVTWHPKCEKKFETMFRAELPSILTSLSEPSRTWNICDVFRPYITNVIVNILRGERYDESDPKFTQLLNVIKQLDDVNLLAFSTLVSLKAPKLGSLFWPSAPSLPSISKRMQEFIREWIKNAPQENKDDVGCVATTFSSSPEYKELNTNDIEMVQSMMDFFFGGVTPVMSLLEFIFLYLLHDPSLQSRVQDEVDKVIGQREVQWDDSYKLPFVQATILEALRLACVTPSSLPHIATKDTEVCGYIVPKGAALTASTFSIHRDPRHYENPDVFKPERHIDSEGKVKTPKSFLPFGVGPRLCLGNDAVRVGVFLMLVSVMQKYSVTPVTPGSPPPFKDRMRIVRRLEPYQIVFTPRVREETQTT